MKLLILISLLYILSSCAVGPLVSHETARTVGNSNHELIGGFGQAGYVAKWNYGLSDNLDIGLHWESFSIGLRAKYAFINSKEGISLASAIGVGSSIGGSHYYADILGSYLRGSWEPYSSLRIVHVKNDPIEFEEESTGHVNFTIPSSEYDYGQYILGTRYWFTKHWLFSLEASSLFAISSGLRFDNNLILGGALGYRF